MTPWTIIIDMYDPVWGPVFITVSVFLYREDPLPLLKIDLAVMNSFSFCLSVKLLISTSYLNEILTGWSNLGCRFFSFISLYMFCHFLLV